MRTVVRVPVTESEAGWGRKIDDYMLCLSVEDALKFTEEFNAKNTENTAPDWYMQVEDEPEPLDITDEQYEVLCDQTDKRMWLSTLARVTGQKPMFERTIYLTVKVKLQSSEEEITDGMVENIVNEMDYDFSYNENIADTEILGHSDKP